MRYNPFRLPTPDRLRQEQREEAEREVVQHEKALEYHASQIAMYRQRLQRLNNTVPTLRDAVSKDGAQ